MSAIRVHRSLVAGPLRIDYLIDAEQHIGLRLIPVSHTEAVVAPRASVPPPGDSPRVRSIEPLVQVHVAGEPLPAGFATGRTLRRSPLSLRLALVEQDVDEDDGLTVTTTVADAESGLCARHVLRWQAGWSYVRISSSISNTGHQTRRLELVTGAVLSDCTPFASDDAPGRLALHRFRSTWSNEGRHVSESLETVHLERSWAGVSIQCERFGQVGSMPVRGWHPWVGVEDTAAGVTWALQPDAPASWQCDCLRHDDAVSLAAGPADHEFGHWWRDLAAGETWTAPAVSATSVAGDVDTACEALVAAIDDAIRPPAAEAGLPVAFNEWCTSWGVPTETSLSDLAGDLNGRGVQYCTIDAGWFLPEQGHWHNAQGDWQPNAGQFPNGIVAAAEAIRAQGQVPGLWFEWEVAGKNSSLWDRHDWLLCRAGQPITVGDRRFLDLRLEPVREWLRERMIGLLRDGDFGYLKMDYNETTGIGPDGTHGPGAELLDATLAAQSFVDEIRAALPELVIECCSSGGHRLEPSWLRLVSQASFSDLHEGRGIPIVAAAMHRLIPVRMNQIWAVLREQDDEARLRWSLTAGLLGRLCLSGDRSVLNGPHRALIDQAVQLANAAAPVLASGRSVLHGTAAEGSWAQPQGWQVVIRATGDQLLVVAHAFAGARPRQSVAFPPGPWQLVDAVAGSVTATAGTAAIEIDFGNTSTDQGGAWLFQKS